MGFIGDVVGGLPDENGSPTVLIILSTSFFFLNRGYGASLKAGNFYF